MPRPRVEVVQRAARQVTLFYSTMFTGTGDGAFEAAVEALAPAVAAHGRAFSFMAVDCAEAASASSCASAGMAKGGFPYVFVRTLEGGRERYTRSIAWLPMHLSLRTLPGDNFAERSFASTGAGRRVVAARGRACLTLCAHAADVAAYTSTGLPVFVFYSDGGCTACARDAWVRRGAARSRRAGPVLMGGARRRAQTVSQLARALKDQVVVGRARCGGAGAAGELCAARGVRRVPAFELWPARSQSPIEYAGPRTVEAFVEFLVAHVGRDLLTGAARAPRCVPRPSRAAQGTPCPSCARCCSRPPPARRRGMRRTRLMRWAGKTRRSTARRARCGCGRWRIGAAVRACIPPLASHSPQGRAFGGCCEAPCEVVTT